MITVYRKNNDLKERERPNSQRKKESEKLEREFGCA